MSRILIVSPSASFDGATTVLFRLLPLFDRKSIDPLLLFPEDGPMVPMFKQCGAGCRIINVGHLGWAMHHVPLLQLLFRREKPDCIHANTMEAYPAVLAARLAGIPVVWHIHEMLTHKQHYAFAEMDERLIPDLVKCSDRICAVSEAAQRAFMDYCTQQQVEIGNKIQVIHNGVPISPASPLPPDRNRNFTITAIGNLVGLKGFNYLIEAFAELVKKHPDARLQIVGKVFPGYFLELYKLAEDLRISDKVSFRTETSEIEAVYLGSHMIVCSSVIETFPMVVLEALSYGKPVVATRVGGIPELVVDGETGLLVPPKEPAALAKAMKYCLEHWDEALQMGSRGRQRVIEKFSLAEQANKFTAVYEELVEGRTNELDRPLDFDELENIIFAHMVSESEKISQLQRNQQSLLLKAETIDDLVRDVRAIESVVANLLNRWPFRIMRALKRSLMPKGHDDGRSS